MGLKKFITGTAAVPLIIVVVLLILYFFFLPPILKYIIENQGEKQLGRKVEVGYASLNILNGSVVIKRFTIYEPGGEAKFLSFRRLFINLSVPDLFKQVYHVESLNLDEPVVHISQRDSTFNFTDILDRFASDTTESTGEESLPDSTGPKDPVKYIVEDFSLTSGTLSYQNPDYMLKDTIRHLNLDIPMVSYDDPLIALSFFFDLASGGNFRGRCGYNSIDQSLTLNDTISNFNLSNYKHYLDPYIKIGSLQGYFHTSNFLEGNASTFDLSMTGNIKLTDFALSDTTGSLVAGFSEFSVVFDSISFSEDIMNFDTISLKDPVINYKVTPEGDNISALLYETSPDDSLATEQDGQAAYSGSNPTEMMVAYIQESMNNYLFQSYRINSIQILNGKVVYDDLSLDEPFHGTLDQMNLVLSHLSTDVERSYGSLEARLNEDGQMTAKISVNPRDILDMELKYEISSLMVPDFNPFSLYYIAHPFPRGTFNYSGSLKILDRKLNSENKIVIEKINIGEKVKNETSVSLPIKLAIVILRDRNGDIKLNIPVEGDLSDPKIRLGRLILGILKNLIIKAATAPFDLLASAFGGEPGDFKEIRFEYLDVNPGDNQKNQLESIAAVLTDKPELNITFTQIVDYDKEKAEIAFFEVKKMYRFEYIQQRAIPVQLTSEDTLQVMDLKVNQEFEAFLTTKLDSTLMSLSLAEKCYQLAGIQKVNLIQQDLVTKRNLALAHYMETVLLVPRERFSVSTSTDPALINPEYPYFGIKFGVNE
jgi:uncharacterized protein involved in outer membrane biogenesis